MDFTPAARGTRIFSEANPSPGLAVLDGRMSKSEDRLDRQSPVTWMAGEGPAGGMICRVVWPLEWKAAKLETYYRDDKTVSDPPEKFPGAAEAGFQVEGLERLPRISATVDHYYYVKNPITAEDMTRFFNLHDHPLVITTRPAEN